MNRTRHDVKGMKGWVSEMLFKGRGVNFVAMFYFAHLYSQIMPAMTLFAAAAAATTTTIILIEMVIFLSAILNNMSPDSFC